MLQGSVLGITFSCGHTVDCQPFLLGLSKHLLRTRHGGSRIVTDEETEAQRSLSKVHATEVG